jgi:hypothetical protein
VLGVVKDFNVKLGKSELISARVAVLEPGINLKALMEEIAKSLNDCGIEHPALRKTSQLLHNFAPLSRSVEPRFLGDTDLCRAL